ncbi:MAG TPA: four-carbon acid sugar kinase family protein [Chitinophagaceae bacterium]|nr:four-carbon acid sugar kinase family protein [Chitinophagaceae bacterium]
MITVIADDFTGAAELAGISLRYGLTTDVCLGEVVATNADVLIICTDSRSLNKAEAVNITAGIVTAVLKLNPKWIYKKIDSVLRGHVLDELKIQMQLTGFSKTFILPAIPSLGRTISNGHYFIEGKRITETGFATDPEFPVTSSSVQDLLGDNDLKVLKRTEQLPASGFVVGEAESENDIIAWANKIDKSWMLAGASDFYTAILNKTFKQQGKGNVEILFPHLYICGTAVEKSKKVVSRIRDKLNCVAYISERMRDAKNTDEDKWLQKIEDTLKQQNKAVMAFDENISNDVSAIQLRTVMAKAVKLIIERVAIKELFIEGGSTAAAILSELKIKKLSPVNELQRGVVRMKAGNMFITVKPGSYEIPKEIMNLYTGNTYK